MTNEGVVAGGLSVAGDFTQRAKGQLVLRDKPLKVSGKVRLAGALDLSAAGNTSAREIRVLDHTGSARTSGAFSGLREGGAVKLGDTVYRISYRGGDGNDVVLTADTKNPTPSTRHESASGAAAGAGAAETRTANTASTGLGWWPYVLAVGLLIGLMVPMAKRRRKGGRHAAH